MILVSVKAQMAYRIEADILTKTRLPDSTFQISKGKIFYDKNVKKIIFDFSFPQPEKVVLFDTVAYTFENENLITTSKNLLIPEQSIFHSMLMGSITRYGFDESLFVANGIDKKKDLVITTWLPREGLSSVFSKILVASKNKQLHSITMFDTEGETMNRQILKEYKLIENSEIPHEILLATYTEKGVVYQVITLKNVILNNTVNDSNYDVKL